MCRAGSLTGLDGAGPVTTRARVRSEFGNYSKTSEGREEAEVLDAQAQPLQDLRTSAGLFTEVWPVPSVFPATGAAGRDPWSFEVVLVSQSSVISCQWFANVQRLTTGD